MKKLLAKIIFSICLIFLVSKAKAQYAVHPMIYAGYEYQNQSFGEIGARFLFLKQDEFLFRLSGGALLGSVHNKFAILPKAQADFLFNTQKDRDVRQSYYFLLGIASTDKYFTPKAGFSLFGIIDLTAGYSLSYGNTVNGKKLEGFNCNFSANIPLVVFHKKSKN